MRCLLLLLLINLEGCIRAQVCANCGTSATSLWRKNRSHTHDLCNACGCYEATNKVPRPAHLFLKDRSRIVAVPAKTPAPASPAAAEGYSSEEGADVLRGALGARPGRCVRPPARTCVCKIFACSVEFCLLVLYFFYFLNSPCVLVKKYHALVGLQSPRFMQMLSVYNDLETTF